MPAFHYIAVNTVGIEKKGVIEADSEKLARQLLRDQALITVQIRPAQIKRDARQGGWLDFLKRKNGLTSKEMAMFTRQFSTLLSAGLPIEESLNAVAEQTEKPAMKGLILSVRGKIVEGHSLAAALSDFPQAFPPLFCATIGAGEKSGHLDKVLLRLADYTEQQWNIQQKMRTALIYPAMIVLVAVGIVGFLLEYVVPKMIGVYARMDQGLPLLTQILIGASHVIKDFGLYFLVAVIVAIIFWRRALKNSALLRDRTHQFLLRLPLIGDAIKTANTARFARTLSILSASGVPVLDAMTISSRLISAIPIRKAVDEAVHRVREGATIHLALKQTAYFSPMSVHMIASGEASGQLENMLERVAMNQEGDITRMIDVVLAMFEPAIILIMGAVVLFIVLAVLLPIFQLNV